MRTPSFAGPILNWVFVAIASFGLVSCEPVTLILGGGIYATDVALDRPISRQYNRSTADFTCREPGSFNDGEISIVMLPYVYFESGGLEPTRFATFDQLTLLIQLETALSSSENGYSVTRLVGSKEDCVVDDVIQRLVKNPNDRSRGPIVILSGRVYEEEESLYVQSNLDYLEPAGAGYFQVPVGPTVGLEYNLVASLPSARIVFPSRKISEEVIETFLEDAKNRFKLFEMPSGDAEYLVIDWNPLDSTQVRVGAAEQGEWLEVGLSNDGLNGYVQRPPQTVGDQQSDMSGLRQLLPELTMLDLLVEVANSGISRSSATRLPNEPEIREIAASSPEGSTETQESPTETLNISNDTQESPVESLERSIESMEGLLETYRENENLSIAPGPLASGLAFIGVGWLTRAEISGFDDQIALQNARYFLGEAHKTTPGNLEIRNLLTIVQLKEKYLYEEFGVDPVLISDDLVNIYLLGGGEEVYYQNIENYYTMVLVNADIFQDILSSDLKLDLENIRNRMQILRRTKGFSS